jgi:phosphoenolpyruvate synthase/pyruvate phosphate dikinase
VIQLSQWCYKIENIKKPMDIEWAKDGVNNQLYIVQARPETVHGKDKTTRFINSKKRYSYHTGIALEIK